jgi:spore germination protein YaaH
MKRPEIVGFLPYWLLGKADKQYERFITTLTYFGIAIQGDGSIMKSTNPGELEPGWNNLQREEVSARLADATQKKLKKSLLIISGEESVIRELLVNPSETATTMMQEIAPIMKEKGFTDLNLDIETFMEASESDRGKFTEFVKTVKDILVSEKLGTLTIDLIPIALMRPKLYDPKELGKLADSVVLMTYDYHYSGSVTSGAVAPIGGAGETIEFDVETSVKEALKVMPKEKILLGVPLYGYQWETISEASESATIPGGSSTASVRRIMEKLRVCVDCKTGIDPYSKEPYLIYKEGDVYNQIYYEDEASMNKKIELAKKYSLGGIALWALGYEDDTLLRPLESYKKSFSLTW